MTQKFVIPFFAYKLVSFIYLCELMMLKSLCTCMKRNIIVPMSDFFLRRDVELKPSNVRCLISKPYSRTDMLQDCSKTSLVFVYLMEIVLYIKIHCICPILNPGNPNLLASKTSFYHTYQTKPLPSLPCYPMFVKSCQCQRDLHFSSTSRDLKPGYYPPPSFFLCFLISFVSLHP
jgi:hypothetical protein